MENTTVRLENITIENFKNIAKGQLSFGNSRKPYRASILGLYGQNGSGKTALIDAIELLQLALKGAPIPSKFADYINIGSETALLHYEFSIVNNLSKYTVYYDLSLKSEKVDSIQNTQIGDNVDNHFKAVIPKECLSYSYEDNKTKIRKETLIDTDCDKIFAPDKKCRCLLGKTKTASLDLIVAKKMAFGSSRSFVFSKELITAIRENKEAKTNFEYVRHTFLIESLIHYGNYELFVINTTNSGMISLNALPLAFKYDNTWGGAAGNILIPLEKAVPIPENAVSMVENVIANLNIVLSQIIPGLTIRVKNLGAVVFGNGEKGIKVQLMSLKNEKEIPLKYESEGIKKIVSILQLLVVVYNRASITVAIDEFDAGVFEYLLGELLRIISEKGKGQLIFTSHNLRPLETLDRGFIAFTTTNPNNRFIRMTKLKENNNLRDFYYRDILLGEQNEELYSPTNNAEISLAFREAGEFGGS